jgi:hypothetical protein
MKREVKLVDFSAKDEDMIALSKKMTPEERIALLFELIELSHLFRSPAFANNPPEDELPFITLKKKQR